MSDQVQQGNDLVMTRHDNPKATLAQRRTARVPRWETFVAEPYQDFVPEVLESRTRTTRRPPRHYKDANLAQAGGISIPQTYQDALNNAQHAPEWKRAIDTELKQLQALNRWEYASLPGGAKTVGGK